MIDESGIIEEILAGNQRAFTQLVDNYKRLVAHIVFKMIPEENDREDVCQEVFVKIYKSLAGFRGDAKLSTWIGRVAYNKCIDYLNKKRISLSEEDFEETAKYIPADHEDAEQKAEYRDMQIAVQAEIDELPVRYGTILVLYHLHDMNYNEIGDVLSMPAGTVKSYLFRGRKLLKERLLSKYNIEEFWQ